MWAPNLGCTESVRCRSLDVVFLEPSDACCWSSLGLRRAPRRRLRVFSDGLVPTRWWGRRLRRGLAGGRLMHLGAGRVRGLLRGGLRCRAVRVPERDAAACSGDCDEQEASHLRPERTRGLHDSGGGRPTVELSLGTSSQIVRRSTPQRARGPAVWSRAPSGDCTRLEWLSGWVRRAARLIFVVDGATGQPSSVHPSWWR